MKIAKNSEILARVFKEQVLFISKPINKGIGASSIVCYISKTIDGVEDKGGYLGMRQVLNELKHHIDKNTDLTLDFTLSRKEGKNG